MVVMLHRQWDVMILKVISNHNNFMIKSWFWRAAARTCVSEDRVEKESHRLVFQILFHYLFSHLTVKHIIKAWLTTSFITCCGNKESGALNLTGLVRE